MERKSHRKFEVGSVWIPMVEREQILASIIPAFASLQKLNIDAIFSKKEKVADKLYIKQLLHKEETQESELLNAVETARYLLGKFARIKNSKRFIINCSFNNQMFVEGQSLQAGLSAGLFTELLHLYQYKEEYALRDDIAITGRVDKFENLQPVDEEGLKLKVETCFFSHIKYLVVPKEQVAVCQSIVEKLAVGISLQESSNIIFQTCSEHSLTISNSNRTEFEIVGISNLEEIFYNRKFTDSRRISIAKQTVRNIWKQRRPIAVVIILLLLLIIGKFWYGPIDKNPVDYSVAGEILSLKNKYGEVVDEIKLGTKTINNYIEIMKIDQFNDLVAFIDLDNDGLNEVVFTQIFQGSSSIVYCKSLQKNKYLWKFQLNRKLSFPRKSDIQSDIFSPQKVAAGDFDNDGNPEIIILTKHNGFFPCIVYKLDAFTGNESGHYLHIGYLNTFRICDIDNNGISEILLTGISNAFEKAVFAVLDPRFISGHSPLTKDYVVEEYMLAAEKAYIAIPRTIVGNYYSLIKKSNSGKLLDIDQPKRIIKINIFDYDRPDAPEQNITLSAFFSFDLKIISFGTDDAYDILSRQLYKEGKISRETNIEYFEEFKKEILYWDGENFVKHPTLNKRYLEAVSALESAKEKQ